MIQFYNVNMEYKKGVKVLHDVSFHVDKGEFVFLVGPSGAGKTTVLRLIYRDLIPTSGEIIVVGKNLSRMKSSQIPYLRRRIGMVFQDFKLLPHRNVFDNIALPMKVVGISRSTIRRNVNQLLHLTGLTHRKDAYPEEISGGEQQRVARRDWWASRRMRSQI
ncbi:TPA: ATP-binding cassette domain-containing protein, partial [Candidatus Poribacteria bacterium]|nr:ATP-binding cassette domain-containing protein [Candidatus Poribacteria bacterium]